MAIDPQRKIPTWALLFFLAAGIYGFISVLQLFLEGKCLPSHTGHGCQEEWGTSGHFFDMALGALLAIGSALILLERIRYALSRRRKGRSER